MASPLLSESIQQNNRKKSLDEQLSIIITHDETNPLISSFEKKNEREKETELHL